MKISKTLVGWLIVAMYDSIIMSNVIKDYEYFTMFTFLKILYYALMKYTRKQRSFISTIGTSFTSKQVKIPGFKCKTME